MIVALDTIGRSRTDIHNQWVTEYVVSRETLCSHGGPTRSVSAKPSMHLMQLSAIVLIHEVTYQGFPLDEPHMNTLM